MTDTEFLKLDAKIRTAAERVMGALGPDHLPEECYDQALRIDFQHRGIAYVSQPIVPVTYEGEAIDTLRPDFYILSEDREAGVVERIILEIKTMKQLTEAERGQVRAYIRHSGVPHALLLNFQYDGRVIIERFGLLSC